jgi:hypothetical protein
MEWHELSTWRENIIDVNGFDERRQKGGEDARWASE